MLEELEFSRRLSSNGMERTESPFSSTKDSLESTTPTVSPSSTVRLPGTRSESGLLLEPQEPLLLASESPRRELLQLSSASTRLEVTRSSHSLGFVCSSARAMTILGSRSLCSQLTLLLLRLPFSSVPPIHTSIGILSLILTNLEGNPFPAAFSPSSPYLQYLQCAADFGPDMSKDLKSRLKDPKAWPALADEFGEDRKNRAFLGTTQAVDMISGESQRSAGS